MDAQSRRNVATAVALILAVLGILGVTVDLNGDDQPDNVVTHVDGADQDRAKDDTLTVPQPAVDQARRAVQDHKNSRDESPPGASVDQLAAGEKQQRKIRGTQKPLPTAGATQSVPGCVTRFVGNQSSRNGVRPQLFVLHYTVSYNRPGWSDVNAIVSMFNNRSVGASSHFVVDAEGNCAYIVPIENKAWTQAGGNSIGVSVEVIAYGNETAYLGPAGYHKLGSVIRTVHARTGIPLTLGSVAGCGVGRKGIVDHFQGGTCWGGHHDIRPFAWPTEVFKILGAVNASATHVLTKGERKQVSRRCYHWKKRHGASHGSAVYQTHLKWSRFWKAQLHANKNHLTRAAHEHHSWKYHHLGSRRKLKARGERLNRGDRKVLCA